MTSKAWHERAYVGKSNDWNTPQHILDAIGPIDDDPCTETEFNGLYRPWRGFAFVNPPYGPYAKQFVECLADHGNGIALLFARTEAKWFHDQVWQRADAIFFFCGRLSFIPADGHSGAGKAPGPSVLVGYGHEAAARLSRLRLPGFYVPLYAFRPR